MAAFHVSDYKIELSLQFVGTVYGKLCYLFILFKSVVPTASYSLHERCEGVRDRCTSEGMY
jgi:hypothetical protein